jgi:hypothetical protein
MKFKDELICSCKSEYVECVCIKKIGRKKKIQFYGLIDMHGDIDRKKIIEEAEKQEIQNIIPVAARVSKHTLKALEKIAEEEGITKSDAVRFALEDYFEKHKE